MDFKKTVCDFPLKVPEILEDYILKLEIISSIPSKLNRNSNNKAYCGTVIEPRTFKPCHEAQELLNIELIQGTCKEICETFKTLKDEMIGSKTFTSLINLVEKNCSESIEEIYTVKKYSKAKKNLEEIERKFEKIQEDQRDKMKDIEKSLLQEIFQFNQTKQNVDSEKRFAEKYIESQVRQSELRILNKENSLTEKIKNLNFMISKEMLTGEAVENFYTYKIDFLNEESKRMSIEYERKMEEAELQYQITKNEKRRSDELIESEKKIFEFRQKQIDDYLAMKAKKEAEIKLRELQEAKSIMLQSWWRGLMVRYYLGSFKKFKKRARKIRLEMRAAKREREKEKKKKK